MGRISMIRLEMLTKMSAGSSTAVRIVREGGYLALMLTVPGAISPMSGQRIGVGTAVPVSPPGSGAHSWTTIAASPTRVNDLIACGFSYSAVRGGYAGVLYHSSDGGNSWQVAVVDSSDDWVSEETCTYGPDGEAYFIAQPHSADKPSPYTRRWKRWVMRLYRSDDGGRTWKTPTVHPMLDATQIAVDGTPGRGRGTIYIFGNSGPLRDPDGGIRTEMRVVVSRDGGKTTSLPLSPDPNPDFRHFPTFPGGVQVLRDGSAVAAYLTGRVPRSSPAKGVDWANDQYVETVTIPAGGNRLTAPVVVHKLAGRCMATWPGIALDRSGRYSEERLYVLSSDLVDGNCRTFLSVSDDGGIRWQSPIEVGPMAVQTNSARPTWRYASLAVSARGIVGITWADDEARCWYVTGSVDGGRTFAPARAVSDCGRKDDSDRASFAPYLQAWDFADSTHVGLRLLLADETAGLIGLTADRQGVFHALWIDTLEGAGRLWTTAIAITDSAERLVASPTLGVSLQGLTDVSKSIELRYSNARYDPIDHVFALDVSVRNIGERLVIAPLYLQVDTLESVLGRPVAADADGHLPDSTTVWDLSQLIPPAGLQAGAVTTSRRIAIRILNYRPALDRRRLHAVLPFIVRMIGSAYGSLAGRTLPKSP